MAIDSDATGRTVARQLAHGAYKSRIRDIFSPVDYWVASAA